MHHNQEIFDLFRTRYPVFTYERYAFEISENRIEMQFFYKAGKDLSFSPVMKLELGRFAFRPLQPAQIEGLIFHIGLIELISYWKCVCSPIVEIKSFRLTENQQQWWKKLYWKGLGEFFYQNGIQIDMEHFMQFRFTEDAAEMKKIEYQRIEESSRVIVPIGGGKDSVVTLEQLRSERQIIPFIINPRGATLACAEIAGFPEQSDIVILHREIDPLLLKLNSQGYLNGHTPFSAMLAFYSLLVSYATDTRDIALSNESSANEPTIPHTDINHQYSKTLEFEMDFRQYVREIMQDVAHYYSHLRPYTELQIAEFFSHYPQYFNVFKSCNAGSKEDKWCCQCSKCLFAYIILSPFIDDSTMIRIFGEDLLDKPSLEQYFDELSGIAEVKPFECVGTIDEVNQALLMISETRKEKYLLKHWKKNRRQ